MNEKLVQKFVHDMRSPLMGIHGNLELVKYLDGKNLSAKGLACLSNSMSAAIELMEMVSSILDLGRLASGERKTTRSRLNLEESCRVTVSKLSGEAAEKPVKIESAGASSDVNADRELVQRVLYILIGNALRYSPRNEQVAVAINSDNRRVRVEVSDRGPLVSDHSKETIFELPADNVAGERSGPGVGLAFCKTVVKAHGGHIGVECPGGCETVFWFELPLL